MTTLTARTTKLDPRPPPRAKQTLLAAAAASNGSVSQFALDNALARAEETLPDRGRFELDAAAWEAFMAARDGPPKENARLRRLLREPPVFDAPGTE